MKQAVPNDRAKKGQNQEAPSGVRLSSLEQPDTQEGARTLGSDQCEFKPWPTTSQLRALREITSPL